MSHFNGIKTHILSVRFKIHCGGVKATNYSLCFNSSVSMDLGIVYNMNESVQSKIDRHPKDVLGLELVVFVIIYHM